jgi:hypothetical protein
MKAGCLHAGHHCWVRKRFLFFKHAKGGDVGCYGVYGRSAVRFDQHPTYREIIVPWYDSRKACLFMVLLMLLVFLFGLIGVVFAAEHTEFNRHLWVPVLLCLLSGGVIISTTVRLIKRYLAR